MGNKETEDQRRAERSVEDPAAKGSSSEKKAPEAGGEACRCKEVARKTPRELLKLALDDLSFWKNKKQ
jgi:hypothetical protein